MRDRLFQVWEVIALVLLLSLLPSASPTQAQTSLPADSPPLPPSDPIPPPPAQPDIPSTMQAPASPASDRDNSRLMSTPTIVSYYIELVQGWNMITPGVISSSSASQIFGPYLISCSGWNADQQCYYNYITLPLNYGCGYWVNMAIPWTAFLTGWAVDGTQGVVAQTIYPSWNLVGNPFETAISWGDVSIMNTNGVWKTFSEALNLGWISNVFHWNRYGVYETPNYAAPIPAGYGFWLKCNLSGGISGIAYARSLTCGFDGVSRYSGSPGYCAYGNRPGAEYCGNLREALEPMFQWSFFQTNDFAWESDFRNLAPTVDFFTFCGHGFRYDYPYFPGEGACHFYTLDSQFNFHMLNDEGNDNANARWGEIVYGSKPRWILLQTCNQLTNGGNQEIYDNIGHMMQGANLIMGFADTMYIDANEAYVLGRYLHSGMTFQNAFFSAVYECQPRPIRARVFGWIPAEYDRPADYVVGTPSFDARPSEFMNWDRYFE